MCARSCACEGVSECAGVYVYSYTRWMCVKCFLVLMYVFTVLFLCFSDCHESTCAFLIVILILIYALFYRTCDYFSVCVKCFNIDVRIYGTLFILGFLSF